MDCVIGSPYISCEFRNAPLMGYPFGVPIDTDCSGTHENLVDQSVVTLLCADLCEDSLLLFINEGQKVAEIFRQKGLSSVV